jgi:hypothetical protein
MHMYSCQYVVVWIINCFYWIRTAVLHQGLGSMKGVSAIVIGLNIFHFFSFKSVLDEPRRVRIDHR